MNLFNTKFMCKSMSNKEELELLLYKVLSTAKFLLEKNGEYYPFAQIIDEKGNITSIASYDGNEHPNSNEVIKLLILSLKEEIKKESIRGIGLSINTNITVSEKKEKLDAIKVQLEHKEGKAMDVYLPYKKLKSGAFEYQEIIAATRTPIFFVNEK